MGGKPVVEAGGRVDRRPHQRMREAKAGIGVLDDATSTACCTASAFTGSAEIVDAASITTRRPHVVSAANVSRKGARGSGEIPEARCEGPLETFGEGQRPSRRAAALVRSASSWGAPRAPTDVPRLA